MKVTSVSKAILVSTLLCANAMAANLKGTFDLTSAGEKMTKTFEFKKDGSVLIFSAGMQEESLKAGRPQIPSHGNYYIDKRTGNILIEIEFSDGRNSEFYKMYIDSKKLEETEVGEEKEIYVQSNVNPDVHFYTMTKQK